MMAIAAGRSSAGALGEALRHDRAQPGQLLLVQRNQGVAVLADPLPHTQAVAPLGKRRRLHPVQVVVEPAIDSLDEQHVLEALRGQIEHSGAAPRVEHVDRHCAPQDQRVDVARTDAGVGQRLEYPGLRVARRRGPLGDEQPAGAFRLLVLHHTDQVGERATRIYTLPVGPSEPALIPRWTCSCDEGHRRTGTHPITVAVRTR